MQREQYAAHAVWTTLEAVQAQVETDLQPWDDASRYDAQRLHAIVEFTDGLRDSEPTLVEPQAVNDLQSHLQSLHNSLTAYVADPQGNQAHLAAAASHIPNLLQVARTHFLFTALDDPGRGVKAAATRYKNSLDAEVERLVQQIDDLQAELAAAKAERDQSDADARQRLDTLSHAIDTRAADIGALELKLQGQVDEQRTAFESDSQVREAAFKKSQLAASERDEARIAAAQKAEAARLEAAIEAENERLAAADEATARAAARNESTSKELIAALESYRDQAKTLADMTSRHAVAGEYGEWASHQARAAFRWTILAVMIGIGTVTGLIIAITSATDDTLQFTLYKTSISIVGLIVAGYAAKQASEHRREERTAKRLALDLAALGPFLEQVNDAEDLRLAVAKRVFAPEPGQPDDGEGTRFRLRGGSSLSMADIVELIKVSRGA
ncbi:hypothetical protein KVF89_22890 [Nocardioides carbamazepini]|uniref:hypothetical protein n=1 Tax=Nocardioides carbamazepini TaxID=2854259 RepID=UPI00214A65DF|nr:hypothetical protein [Nocardioides carbamazepini]MCR1785405.1 hypothetical protein [Nocardioides carbamazepini]